MERKKSQIITGYKTTVEAGVSLVGVLGCATANDFDPMLFLYCFNSED